MIVTTRRLQARVTLAVISPCATSRSTVATTNSVTVRTSVTNGTICHSQKQRSTCPTGTVKELPVRADNRYKPQSLTFASKKWMDWIVCEGFKGRSRPESFAKPPALPQLARTFCQGCAFAVKKRACPNRSTDTAGKVRAMGVVRITGRTDTIDQVFPNGYVAIPEGWQTVAGNPRPNARSWPRLSARPGWIRKHVIVQAHGSGHEGLRPAQNVVATQRQSVQQRAVPSPGDRDARISGASRS